MDELPKFTVEESRALMLYIWPDWSRHPGSLRGVRPAPSDLAEWLRIYRASQSVKVPAASQSATLPHFG